MIPRQIGLVPISVQIELKLPHRRPTHVAVVMLTLQGISAGCKDIYWYNIDCQWMDITDLSPGLYQLSLYTNQHDIII